MTAASKESPKGIEGEVPVISMALSWNRGWGEWNEQIRDLRTCLLSFLFVLMYYNLKSSHFTRFYHWYSQFIPSPFCILLIQPLQVKMLPHFSSLLRWEEASFCPEQRESMV